jgi:hypothetical protein
MSSRVFITRIYLRATYSQKGVFLKIEEPIVNNRIIENEPFCLFRNFIGPDKLG